MTFKKIITTLVCCAAILTDWQSVEAEEPLTLGVFPRRDAETTVRYFKPLVDHLTRELGHPVELVTTHDYESFWEKIKLGHFDIVHYNQYQYVKSARDYGYQVIVKNEEFGSDKVSGTLFTHQDSEIKTIADLRGNKVVFGGGPTAMISTIVPIYLLRSAGIEDNEYIRDHAKNPPSAVFATYYGHAAAGGAGDISVQLPSVTQKINVDKLRPLAVSKPLTHLPWAVSPGMESALKNRIVEVLTGLKMTEEGRQILSAAELTGLLTVQDEEYDQTRRIIWEVLGENYCKSNCDWLTEVSITRTQKGPIIIGVFPRRPQKMTSTMFSPFAQHLSNLMGREVKLAVAKDFEEFWKGVSEKKYDLVHYNQYQYVKSRKLYGYQAIARNEEQGQSMISAVVWTRKDSGIESLEDLKGKKIIFGGGRMAMMAFIGPSYLLKQSGLEESDYDSVFAINPLSGCKAMYLGQAEACGSGDIMFRLPALAEQVDINKVHIIAQGEPLAFMVWAVKDSMSDSLQKELESHLVNMAKTPEGGEVLKLIQMTAFIKATDSEFDAHRKMIESVTGEQY